jgi:hypothetical protein
MSDGRTVLFLGAGASRPFGFPVTAEILPEILRRLEPSPGELGDLLGRFLPALFGGAVAPPLITDLLSLVDHLIATGNAPQPGIGAADLDRLRLLLEQAVADVLAEPSVGPGGHGNEEVLQRFVAWIRRRADEGPGRVSLITTNYDVVLEKRLYALLDSRDIPDLVDFGVSWRPADRPGVEPARSRPAAPWLGLFKLHGSLDWLRCPLCEHIYIDPARTVVGGGTGSAARARTCVCGYAPLRHIIVAPSAVRDIRDPSLLSIWHSALEALRTADEWTVVGYSLPPEDVAIRSLLLRASRGRERPPVVHLVERGENPEVQNRYRLLFPDLHFQSTGVEGLVASLGSG